MNGEGQPPDPSESLRALFVRKIREAAEDNDADTVLAYTHALEALAVLGY